MYYSKFLKDKSSKNWEQYRLRRNLVNKLKRKSENNYFQERCTGGCKQTELFVLNRGVTCASFSLFGKIPESIDMFIIFVIGDKSDILPSFINLTEIL
jgi:predicted CoA-binding protein